MPHRMPISLQYRLPNKDDAPGTRFVASTDGQPPDIRKNFREIARYILLHHLPQIKNRQNFVGFDLLQEDLSSGARIKRTCFFCACPSDIKATEDIERNFASYVKQIEGGGLWPLTVPAVTDYGILERVWAEGYAGRFVLLRSYGKHPDEENRRLYPHVIGLLTDWDIVLNPVTGEAYFPIPDKPSAEYQSQLGRKLEAARLPAGTN